MVKRTKEDEVENQTDDAPIDYGNRPEIGDAETTDLETLAHNWQPGSPAADMRDVSKPLVNQENLVQVAEAAAQAKEDAEKADKPVLTADEHKERTQLDVSDPRYINPSLDHHDVTDDK